MNWIENVDYLPSAFFHTTELFFQHQTTKALARTHQQGCTTTILCAQLIKKNKEIPCCQEDTNVSFYIGVALQID